MNVLAIGCHPDDIEIGCAGTLAKYSKLGHKVTVCHVANGNLGHEIIEPENLCMIRKKEAENAGALAGIEVVTCDIGDLLVYDGEKRQRDLVVDVIRKTQPDVIITLAGVNFLPTEYVDISETIELKLEMLECHISQLKWMRDHDNIDFAEFVKTCARFRGLQCGVNYAEGFTKCYAWPKLVPRRLLP